MFGVSHHAVLRAIDRGDLEAERVFNRLRISSEALDAYRAARRVVPRPAAPVRVPPAPPAGTAPRASDTQVGSLAHLRAIEREALAQTARDTARGGPNVP
jgi:hypothetical protein